MTHILEEWIELIVPREILIKYWDSSTDHADFRKILECLDKGGQTTDIPKILIALDSSGFRIVRK